MEAMNNRFKHAPSVLRDGVIAISAYDAAGACIARESRSTLDAYTGAIDLIDEPGARRALRIRRIVAEQSARSGESPVTRWAMVYDENGALTDAVEQNLAERRSTATPSLADTGLRLAQRLRWIGVPGSRSETSDNK